VSASTKLGEKKVEREREGGKNKRQDIILESEKKTILKSLIGRPRRRRLCLNQILEVEGEREKWLQLIIVKNKTVKGKLKKSRGKKESCGHGGCPE